MKLISPLILLIVLNSFSCEIKVENPDPCIDKFNLNFPQILLKRIPELSDVKIYSYPQAKQLKRSMDLHPKPYVVECEELILELKYDYEVNLEAERSIQKAVKFAFRDTFAKMQKLNLRIISKLPTTNDTYLKNKIDEFSINHGDSLSCELIQSNYLHDSLSYSLIGSYNDKIILPGEITMKNFTKTIFSFNSNYVLLDDMALVIKKEIEKNFQKRDLTIVLIKIEQPNYYRINGEENRLVFSSYEYIYKE